MKIRTERGRLVYDINTMGPAGEVRERRNVPSEIHSESAAKRWADARALHLAKHGKDEPLPEAVPTLAIFVERWMNDYAKANGNKPSTLNAKERINRLHLLPTLGAVRLDAIGDAEVQQVKLAAIQNKAAAKTQACILAQLATILGTAERWGIIPKAPHIELPRVSQAEMEFYDFDEWERLVEGAAKVGPMVYAMVLLSGEAGLRRGELIALDHGDCGTQEIVIRRSEWWGEGRAHVGLPKSGKTRRVPLTSRLRTAIAKVRHLRGKRLLFQDNGRKVGISTLQSWMEVATKRAGLPVSLNVHKLRHTFCSHLAMRGATAKAIQELAGHADIKTTMRYMHLSPAHKESAIKLLEQRGAANGAGVEQVSPKA